MTDLPEVEFAKHSIEENQKEIARTSAQSDVDAVRAKCEHCGEALSSYRNGCPTCGAPVCCQKCCHEERQYQSGIQAAAGGMTQTALEG